MQALILAAGMGKRLGQYTRDRTKCMIEVNGKTLIARALKAVKRTGIDRVIVVAGYYAERLEKFIEELNTGLEILYVYNEDYETTNNIYSLWLAKKYLAMDDTILLESDIIFEDKILINLVRDQRPNLAVVAKYERHMSGTVVSLDKEDSITSFVPSSLLSFDEIVTFYKTVNIYKFSREFSTDYYIPFLDAYIYAFGNQEFYEQVLKVLSPLEKVDLRAYIITDEKWYEIDDAQDLEAAERLF